MRALLFIVVCAYLSRAESQAQEQECYRGSEELKCVNRCPPEKNCKNRDIKFRCVSDQVCETKCVCKTGLYRNPLGDCISKEQCDECPGRHEFYACGSACDNVCSDLAVQNRTSCPILNIKCNERCYCEDGYARDEHGDCVPVEQCTTTTHTRLTRESDDTCTGENEVFTDCKKSCPPQLCISILAFFKCDSKEVCKPGCVCKPGFLRKSDKSPCVPTCQCPELRNEPNYITCPGPNEEFTECKKSCPPETCLSIVARFACDSSEVCKPGCVCKAGFLRNGEQSHCIPLRECPQLAHSPDFN